MFARVSANPLLQIPLRVPFDRIRPEHVEPAIHELLAEARAAVAAIVAEAGPRSYANTLGALDRATERLDLAMGVVGHLESVATTAELRAAYNAVQAPVAEFYAGLPLDPGLWQALRSYADTDDAKALTGARLRFLTRTLDDFRRHGAELPPEGKARLSRDPGRARPGHHHLQRARPRRHQRLRDDPQRPRRARRPPRLRPRGRPRQRRGPRPRGHRFTLQQPSLLAFLTHSDRADLRERLYRAANICAEPGPHDNRDLLAQILRLRHEQATLLGFADFPDLVLHNRMARRGATARDFVATLRDKVTAAFHARERRPARFPPPARGPRRPRAATMGPRLLRREAAPGPLRLRRRGPAPLLPRPPGPRRPVRRRRPPLRHPRHPHRRRSRPGTPTSRPTASTTSTAPPSATSTPTSTPATTSAPAPG
jgi:oligopeptidase A